MSGSSPYSPGSRFPELENATTPIFVCAGRSAVRLLPICAEQVYRPSGDCLCRRVLGASTIDIRREVAPVWIIVQIILLVAMTAFLVLSVLGTVGKLLFDDWRVRQAMRLLVPLVSKAEKPASPASG
jgi:hypothetical protein